MKYLDRCEVIVVNDDPTESIKDVLNTFPTITLLENKKNLGFAGAVNVGVKKSNGSLIMLLNSDVIILDRSYQKAVAQFEKEQSLFAVSFAQVEQGGKIVGKNTIYFENGFFQHKKSDNLDYGINGWAEGGSCLIDKKKLDLLQCFDETYSPFYWEDVDLSYRAWKSGYTVVFDPQIKVEHHHESTIGSFFSKRKIETIAYRNQFLFIWKNIIDKNLVNLHKKILLKSVLKNILRLNIPFVAGFFQAVLKSGQIRKQMNSKLSDQEVLQKFESAIQRS